MDEKQREERKHDEAPPRRRPAGLFRTIVLTALAACPAAGCYESNPGDDVADTADATDARDGADDAAADDASADESVLAYGVPDYGAADYAAPMYYAP